MNTLGDWMKKMESDISPGNMPTSLNIEANDGLCHICGAESICEGLGVIRFDVPVGDPRFGKLFRCPNNPVEADVERHSRLRRVSNLDAYADKSFYNFVADRPGLEPQEKLSLEASLAAAIEFTKTMDGWLLLSGTYGCGKTHLAAAIGNARLQQGDNVLFMTAPDLLDHLRGTFAPSSEVNYDETFERIRNAPLLILDDLGAESPSSWAQEKLYQIFNHRYAHRLPTVITTNVDIDRLDPRIRSRLLDGSLIRHGKIIAPDFRTAQKPSDSLSGKWLYSEMTFDRFDTDRNATHEEQMNLRKALEYSMAYAQDPRGWFLIMGANATGKTHLAAAISNQLTAHGKETIFITVADLLDYLRVTFNPNAPVTFDERFQSVRTAPFLVLDDLTASGSAWAKEKLFQIIDYRYVAQLPTVITTYLQLEELDNRIRTRILDRRRCFPFSITARDFPTRFKPR